MRTLRTLGILVGILAVFAAAPAGAMLHALRPVRMCPMIWRPVCAVTPDGQRKTFGNRCLAQAVHARIKHDGECRLGRS